MEVGPRSAEAHNWLGVALSEKSDLPGAVAEFRKAVELDPKYGRAYTNLGSALATSGDYAEAVEVFQKALAPRAEQPGRPLQPGHGPAGDGRPGGGAAASAEGRRGRPDERRVPLRARPDAAPERRSRGRRRRASRRRPRWIPRSVRPTTRSASPSGSRARPPAGRRLPREEPRRRSRSRALAAAERGELAAAREQLTEALASTTATPTRTASWASCSASRATDAALAHLERAVALGPSRRGSLQPRRRAVVQRLPRPGAGRAARERPARPRRRRRHAFLGIALRETGDLAGARAACSARSRSCRRPPPSTSTWGSRISDGATSTRRSDSSRRA